MNSLTVCNQNINVVDGLYSLNDLHKASGNQVKHKPSNFLQNQETKAIITEIESENLNDGIPSFALKVVRGAKGGTYVCRELVYRYAMWISAKFSLMVIRAFDAVTGGEFIPVVQQTTTDERTPLRQAVTALVGKAKIMHDEAYNMVNQYMGVNHIWEIPKEDLPKAVAYVHSLTLLLENTVSSTAPTQHADDIKHLIAHAFITRSWINAVKEPLRMLNPHLVSGIDGMSAWNSEIARILNKRMNLGVDTKLLEKNWGQQFLPAC